MKVETQATVRAVASWSFGGPEVLEIVELPRPVLRRGWVVVDVVAATVNPTDLLFRSGAQAASMSRSEGPYIPGMEFAGIVSERGEGVGGLPVGAPVIGVVDPRRPEGGAQAERIAVPADSLAALAGGANLVAAATIPMNGLTARAALDLLDLPAGASLLVTGAAGAVGGNALQLASERGLHVVADASAGDRELVLSLCPDATVVPRGEGMETAVRALFPEGVDGLVDTALLGERATGLVRAKGAWASLRRTQEVDAPHLTRHTISVVEHFADTAALHELAAALDTNRLTPRIARSFAADAAADAHRMVEAGGLRGRVVLTFR